MTQTLNQDVTELPQSSQPGRPKRWVVASSSQPLKLNDLSTLTQAMEGKYEYVESDLFEQPDAMRQVFEDAPDVPRPDSSWYHPVMENMADGRSGSVGSVLLNAQQERALFLQYNYCRYRVCRIKEQTIESGRPMKVRTAKELLDWHRQAEGYRDQIAQTNLALVLAMAKRTRLSENDFADMVSEGNMALLRAIDKFDVARGFKFSTYACRAILKAFSRNGVKLTKYRQMFPTDYDPKLEKSNHQSERQESHEDDCVHELRTIILDNRADLSPIEKEVIEHRFALGHKLQQDPQAQPLTLEQVGQLIGVTKERVRQIQNKALQKIRVTLEEGFLS